MYSPYLVGVLCLLVSVSSVAAQGDSGQSSYDEQILKSAQVPTDGSNLLSFFKKRTSTSEDRTKVQALIQQLGDVDFEKRQKATQELLQRGPVIIRQLKDALKDPDLEVVHRAGECLQSLTKEADPSVTSAAVRLIANKKPQGTLETLFAYVPFATDEVVVEELRAAFKLLAVHDGKPSTTLLDALEDKLPLRRAIAAEALARTGNADLREKLKKYFKDGEPLVRMWTAFGLIEAHDKEAVPVLIEGLNDWNRENAWRIEDVLCRIAGEKTPSVPLGTDAASRKKCRDVWLKWWDEQGKSIDLAAIDLENRMLGYTLIASMGVGGIRACKVMELGVDGKPRWQIENLVYCIDARVVGNDRVLLTEYTGRTVSERNFKGEVLWQYNFAPTQYPLCAQRLPNGNTFVACRNALVELSPEGKEVSTIPRTVADVMGALKMRDGRMVVNTNVGGIQILDPTGKEQKSFALGNAYFGGGFDVLNNGRILCPVNNQNKVVEVDLEGKTVWEASVQNPTHVSRLPNGNTLVVTTTQDVIELGPNGKEISRMRPEGNRIFKARRR